MKFVCLGYADPGKFTNMTPAESEAMMKECFAYDDVLRKGGHFVGGEALKGPQSGVTLRYINKQVTVTDGPITEAKEQLGGILFLEARDLNHAIQLISKHPGVRFGPFEIRPAEPAILDAYEAMKKAGLL